MNKARIGTNCFAGLALFFAVAGTNGCGTSPPKTTLHAGGSTLVAPLMSKWATAYETDGKVKIAYEVIGSGQGIRQTIAKTLDFGLSDAPLTDQEQQSAQKTGGDLVHIPLALGAVVPVYHLEDIDHAVQFTGPLLADIFLGKIKKWNDPRLQVIQEPGVKLPDKEIVVAHRSDGSGTTYVFTDYLSKVSAEWREQFGFATEVKWPTGTGYNGNQGVADYVKKTPGAIGYIELAFVFSNDVQWGAVQNHDGSFVQANSAHILAAADAALGKIPDDLRFSLTDAPGKESYPICGATWALVYVNPPKHAKEIADCLRWVIHEGQQQAKEEGYAPLPLSLLEKAERQIAKINTK